MRTIFMALLAALVLLLSSCGTSTPKPNNVCVTGTDCSNPDDPDNGGQDPNGENPGGEDPDGEDPDGEDPDGENPDGENPDGENPSAFDHSLMKGFVSNYQGDKALTVKSLWIDQSNGQIIDLGTDPMARLEKNGEFGVRLGKPGDASLATLPLPIDCGTLTTTTVPAGLTSVKGLLVPALFVFDGDQLVGLIIHGSYHVDENGEIVPSAKLAMRVYSATEKIISKGECSGRLEANALAGSYDAIVGGLAGLGVNSPEINEVLGELAMANTPALDVNLSVDVGLKKGWNTVVLGAELVSDFTMMAASSDESNPSLNITLIDDTKPNFTWYFLDLTQFTMPIDPK
jgi:hypothetical protein